MPRVPASVQNVEIKQSPILHTTAGTYLVVCRPDLAPALEPFLQWKREQGFATEVLMPDTNLRDSIRAQLIHRYQHANSLHPQQRYVLIVGDVDRIKGFSGQHTPSGLNPHTTDLYYGEYTGDYIPEAWVGRLSVADADELALVINKIIAYEKGLWAQAERVTLTAGRENRDQAPTTTNGQVNYLAQLIAEHRPNLDTTCFRNPQSDSLLPSILQSITQRNALVNYTAHCTRTGWNAPQVDINTLETLGFESPTVWVNNCCHSNAFVNNCFGEDLLRMPQGGAVGVIGATNESLWNEDYFWAIGAQRPISLSPTTDTTLPGAFDQAILGHADPDLLSLGALNYAGCAAVTHAGSPFDAFYWEIYCLLGDPSMTLFWGNADTLHLSAPDSIEANSTQLQITTTPFARISATNDSFLLGTTLADAQGNALLEFTTIPPVGTIKITATRPEYISASRSLTVLPTVQANLVVRAVAFADRQLYVTISNVGRQTSDSANITISQNSREAEVGLRLDLPLSAMVGPLMSQADTTLCFNLANFQLGREPLLAAHLAIDSATFNFVIETGMDSPQLEHISILEADGTPAHKVFANHDYLIVATFSFEPDTISLTVNNIAIGSTTAVDSVAFLYHTPDDLGHLHLDIMSSYLHDIRHHQRWILGYQATEDFETATLDHFPWQCPTGDAWLIDSALAHGGHQSVRSAPIGHSQWTILQIDLDVLSTDSISFYFHVSSEAHDWLYFYVDGRKRGYWSGNQDWQYYARELTAGKHRLQWIYQKDATITELNDCAHIDDIRLPLSVWHAPYGHAVPEEEPRVGISDITMQQSAFYASPNPSASTTSLFFPASRHERLIQVFDITGKLVDEIKIPINFNSTQYSTTHLRLGIYTLVLHDDSGRRIAKIIVTR